MDGNDEQTVHQRQYTGRPKNWASDAKLNDCFDSHMAAVSNLNGYSIGSVLVVPAQLAVSSLLKLVVVAKAHIAKICVCVYVQH